MIRILFVCLGNICRSPMAEFVLKDMVKKAGLSSGFHIESAAVSAEELGNPVYPPVAALLRERGISCKGKTARQLRRADYESYDYHDCPYCKAGKKVDALVNSFGYSSL